VGSLTGSEVAIGAPVVCECGDRLVEVLGDTYIVLDDEQVPFRRRTDYLLCDSCGLSFPVQLLRALCQPPVA
jgi:hypothetical protein